MEVLGSTNTRKDQERNVFFNRHQSDSKAVTLVNSHVEQASCISASLPIYHDLYPQVKT